MRNHSRDLEYLNELRGRKSNETAPSVRLILPRPEDLWLRQKMMDDPATMSYNHVWGGTIPFPEEKWQDWYDHWVRCPEGKRFYRYAVDAVDGHFVGETAYHWDGGRSIWCADVIILAEYRRRGYGRVALHLLCEAARANGVDVLQDDIAIDNPAVQMFLAEGFVEEYRTEEIIMLKKRLC